MLRKHFPGVRVHEDVTSLESLPPVRRTAATGRAAADQSSWSRQAAAGMLAAPPPPLGSPAAPSPLPLAHPSGDGAADRRLPLHRRQPRGPAPRAGGPVHGAGAPRLPPTTGAPPRGHPPCLQAGVCAVGVCRAPLRDACAAPLQPPPPPPQKHTHPAPPQRAADDRRPVPWVLLENVEALLDRHGGEPPVIQVMPVPRRRRRGCGAGAAHRGGAPPRQPPPGQRLPARPSPPSPAPSDTRRRRLPTPVLPAPVHGAGLLLVGLPSRQLCG